MWGSPRAHMPSSAHLLAPIYSLTYARLTDARARSQVVSSTGDEVFFKIKRNTKLLKLQSAYANKVGKDVASIR